MATSNFLTIGHQCLTDKPLLLRVAAPEFNQLKHLVFGRYPEWEWATFARFGWRETPNTLVVTLASVDPPSIGDLNENVGHVAIDERYTLRMALAAEKHSLAVGIIHSHPQGGAPCPSPVDDDMDAYYSEYFADFAKDRPYISLILSEIENKSVISGRAFWRGRWLTLQHTSAENLSVTTWPAGRPPAAVSFDHGRAARLASAFGDEALARLRASTVAIIGAGGTGSAAIEVLARAGVGQILIVDPDIIEDSNLERVHGSLVGHLRNPMPKAEIAREHVRSIDQTIKVEALIGRVLQDEVIDAITRADVALGCTDQQHSRLALSDIAFCYIVPVIDCGVVLEGREGNITGQVAQFVRFLSHDPCALCREMVDPVRVTQELMSEEERAQRYRAAKEAQNRGEDPDPYWRNEPQLHTVGYLTTMTGAMAAGYVIGWLTGRFAPPFERLQMNLVAPYLDVTDLPQAARDICACRQFTGWADQANADALISAPEHWPPVRRI